VQSRFLQVPWRDLVYSLGEHFTVEELRRILATPRETVARKRKLINFICGISAGQRQAPAWLTTSC